MIKTIEKLNCSHHEPMAELPSTYPLPKVLDPNHSTPNLRISDTAFKQLASIIIRRYTRTNSKY